MPLRINKEEIPDAVLYISQRLIKSGYQAFIVGGAIRDSLLGLQAKDMTEKFGRGFSERNLRNMRAFYLNFPIRQTLPAKSPISQTPSDQFEPMLSWSHYKMGRRF